MKIIEIEGHKVVLDYLNENSIVFDCGACVGEFTSKLYDILKCRFICFEPDFRNFRKLKRRFAENKQITPLCIGIDTEIGFKELYLGSFNTSSSFYESHRGLSGLTVEVPVRTLELETESYDLIDLLKLDLEGSEIEVIPSMADSVMSKIKQITVEFHSQSKIEGYTKEKIDICRKHLKKQFNEIEYIDKGNDGHHGLYLNKEFEWKH